jgi:hypothetical protein
MTVDQDRCLIYGLGYPGYIRGLRGLVPREEGLALTEKLPLISGDSQLASALNRIKESDRSGCVMLDEGGAVLFHIDILELQLPERSWRPIRQIQGGQWIPSVTREDEPFSAVAALLNHDERSATLCFSSDILAADYGTSPRRYRCDLDRLNHSYSGMQVRSFQPHPGGGYKCPTRDGGKVT